MECTFTKYRSTQSSNRLFQQTERTILTSISLFNGKKWQVYNDLTHVRIPTDPN